MMDHWSLSIFSTKLGKVFFKKQVPELAVAEPEQKALVVGEEVLLLEYPKKTAILLNHAYGRMYSSQCISLLDFPNGCYHAFCSIVKKTKIKGLKSYWFIYLFNATKDGT